MKKKIFVFLMIIFLSILLLSASCQSTKSSVVAQKSEFYTKAIAEYPQYNPEILKKIPEEYLTKEGLFLLILNEAVDKYNTAIANEDLDLLLQAANMFFYVYGNMGFQVAKDYLDKIEEYKKKKIVEYANNALKYEKNKDILNAAKFWAKVLKLDPQNNQAKEFFNKNNELIRKEIAKYLEEAKKQLANQKYDEAIKLFMSVLSFDPNNLEAKEGLKKAQEEKNKAAQDYFNKGKEAFDKKDYSKAQKYFKLALDLGYDKRLIKSYLDKIEFYLNAEKYYQSSLEAYNKQDYFTAEDYAKKIMNLDPNYKDIKELYDKIKQGIENILLSWYNQAIELFNQKIYDKALELFQKIAKYNPNYKDVQNYIQMCTAKLQALGSSSISGSG